jgi:carbon monoxide dehydrogenase subunit G
LLKEEGDMKVEGSYKFNAPREEVWSAILDPEVLGRTLPGGQELERVAENQYKAKMKIKVGPVQGVFSGTVNLSDLKPPESYHLDVQGNGAPGFVKGEGNLRLEAHDGSTMMHYNGDAQVGGRLASVGQRLMDTSAQALIRQSLEALDVQIMARHAAPDGEAVELPPPPEAPSEIEFAAGVAKKMLEDTFPPEEREQQLRTGLIALAVISIVWIIGNWWTNRLADRIAKKIDERMG